MAKNERQRELIAGGQRWTLLAAIAILGLVIILGVATFWPHPESEAPGVPGITAPITISVPESCQVPAGSQAFPTSPPQDVVWAAQFGNTWPTSPSIGPTAVREGVSGCFARSPMGAALAAVGILQTARIVEPALGEKIVTQQFVDNPGRAAFLDVMKTKLNLVPPAQRVWGRSEGFAVKTYTPDRATIMLVENWPQRAQLTGNLVTVVWQGNDWKIELEPDGYLSHPSDVAVMPGNYVPWGGSIGGPE